ncbi:hypothetical protein C8R43DRAFT_453380 [Mycena crocata]|nr:hypothetical protein C8R43DRAFT_453380 [Mycena crocata]
MTTTEPFQAIAPPWIGMLSVTEDTLATCPGICELCRRHTDHLTQHHLFPRAAVKRAADSGFPFTPEQKNSVAALCWPCHCIVHRLIRADILAAAFHSIDLLRTHGGSKCILIFLNGHLSNLSLAKRSHRLAPLGTAQINRALTLPDDPLPPKVPKDSQKTGAAKNPDRFGCHLERKPRWLSPMGGEELTATGSPKANWEQGV